MKKRFVAFLLVLIMVLGMLPVSALAAGSVVTARGSAENPIRIYEHSGNQAETSNGSVQVPVGETVTDSGVLTFSTYSAFEGVQVSTGGFTYCDITSSNENVVKATGGWNGGVLTINFQGVGNGTARITVDYSCTCSKGAAAKGYLIYNVTVGDGGTTDPSGKPEKPGKSDLDALTGNDASVALQCDDLDNGYNNANKHDLAFRTIAFTNVVNGYSVGEVVANDGNYVYAPRTDYPWMCEVTVYGQPFVDYYNSSKGRTTGAHYLKAGTATEKKIHLFYDGYSWEEYETLPVVFQITKSHSHSYTYTDNGDGTHTGKCTCGATTGPEAHIPDSDGFCTKCGACTHEHEDGYCIVPGCTHGDCCPKKPSTDNKPLPPKDDDIRSNLWVTVVCKTYRPPHEKLAIALFAGDYTIADTVDGDAESGFTCKVTVQATKYIEQYSKGRYVEGGTDLYYGRHRLVDGEPSSKVLTLIYKNGTWTIPAGGEVNFNVECDNTQPSDPGEEKPVIKDDLQVLVTCKSGSTNHPTLASKAYGLNNLYDDRPGKGGTTGAYTYTITLKKDEFIKLFDADTGKTHTTGAELIPITWDWTNGAWVLRATGDYAATINCECSAAEDKPSKPALNEGSPVLVQCVQTGAHTDSGKDLTKRYFALGGYAYRYEEVTKEGSNVWKDEADGKWTYQLKLKRDEFVKDYNNLSLVTTHTDTNPNEVTYVTWKHNGTSWKLVPAAGQNSAGIGAVINVTCKPKAPTADELKKLDMAVLVKCVVDGTQQHARSYGLLGDLDYDYYVGEPEEINGDWLCTIEFVETRYVEAFTTVLPGHVRNDEKIIPVTLIWYGSEWTYKTQGRVEMTEEYTVTFDPDNGTAETTQNVIYGGKATEPAEPKKPGYTFKGWYLDEAEAPFDFGTPITSDITLTAKWSPATVYLFVQPVDSQGVKLVDRDTSIKDKSQQNVGRALNADTLARAGFKASKFGGYNHSDKEWITVGKMTTKQDLPTFQKMTDITDTWLNAVKGELETGTYTPHADAEGFKANISQAIWTKLQYMPANYSHRGYDKLGQCEGYHLDGKLTFYATGFFNGLTYEEIKNGEKVEGMPENNYGDIYDYYITGGTVTMPDAPTRDGYTFLGWEAVERPDDPICYSDPTTDAGTTTKLYKSGETYTIGTKDVMFVARWEKKTFTVKYYLPDETGAWVEKKMDTVDSVDYANYILWTPNAEDGYEFSGWYQKTSDIGVKAKVEQLYMAKEWKLYGKFTPIEYTIQYVYNDGKATSTNPTTYTVESEAITLADATGADWGKTFLEWHDENDQKITEIPTGSTGNRVIKAYWNWPVYLHYLDKNNNEIDSATLYVSELDPSACDLPTGEKTGYDFDGWYEAKNDIGTASHKLNALSRAKKWELYGRYTAKTDVSYTVKYLRSGDDKVLATEKVVTGQTFDTEVTEEAATVKGYTADAASKKLVLDDYNKVLTFYYTANTDVSYTVKYLRSGDDKVLATEKVVTGQTFDTEVTD